MDQVLEADDENKTQSLTLSMYKLHPLSYNWFILCQDYDAYIYIPFVAVEQGEELQVQVMQCLRRQQIHLAAGWLEEALSGSTRSTHIYKEKNGWVCKTTQSVSGKPAPFMFSFRYTWVHAYGTKTMFHIIIC